MYYYVFLSKVLVQNCEKRLLAASCLSIRPSVWNNSAPTGADFNDIFYFIISVEIM